MYIKAQHGGWPENDICSLSHTFTSLFSSDWSTYTATYPYGKTGLSPFYTKAIEAPERLRNLFNDTQTITLGF